jgi:hypothetical protein
VDGAAALHQKFLDGSADLGHDRSLLPWKQNRLRVYGALNRGFFHGHDLHAHHGFSFFVAGRTASC